MYVKRLPGRETAAQGTSHQRPCIVIFLLFMLYLAGCGSNTTAGANAAATSTATSCQQTVIHNVAMVTGTLQGINGTTLTMHDTSGKSIPVRYTNTTSFDQEKLLTSADLHDGLNVVVVVIQYPDHSYTARMINIRDQGEANQITGVKKASSGCPATIVDVPGGKGPGGQQKGDGPGTQPVNTNAKGVLGTISQVSGNRITVTDASGNDYIMGLTAQTQIVRLERVTPGSLKIGGWLNVLGTKNSANIITASSITLLLHAPAATKHA
ncbi:MAG: DUF5666 domain-containing protein [Chloroflexota bacterium]|nr:DUF5666 domain-containing protein [Chloroflexota bacterium]